jgi:hypothetical protein
VLQQTGLSLACGSLWRPWLNAGTLDEPESRMGSRALRRKRPTMDGLSAWAAARDAVVYGESSEGGRVLGNGCG